MKIKKRSIVIIMIVIIVICVGAYAWSNRSILGNNLANNSTGKQKISTEKQNNKGMTTSIDNNKAQNKEDKQTEDNDKSGNKDTTSEKLLDANTNSINMNSNNNKEDAYKLLDNFYYIQKEMINDKNLDYFFLNDFFNQKSSAKQQAITELDKIRSSYSDVGDYTYTIKSTSMDNENIIVEVTDSLTDSSNNTILSGHKKYKISKDKDKYTINSYEKL